MDGPSSLIDWLPTAIAALFAGVSAIVAIQQHRFHRASAQPYVWVDIRPDTVERGLLTVVVGNSGSTFATNVRATFNPPLPEGTLNGNDEAATKRLRDGLPSLGPGRQLSWALGMGHVVMGQDVTRRYTITIDANGLKGRPLPQLRYDVDVISYKEVLIRPEGSLDGVRQAIRGLSAGSGGSDAAHPRM